MLPIPGLHTCGGRGLGASWPPPSSSGGGGEGKISSSRGAGGNGSSIGGGGGGKAPPRVPSASSPSPRRGGGGKGKSGVRKEGSQQGPPLTFPESPSFYSSNPQPKNSLGGPGAHGKERGRKTPWDHRVRNGRGLGAGVVQLPLHFGKRTRRGRFVSRIPASHPQAKDLDRSQEPWLSAMSSTMR